MDSERSEAPLYKVSVGFEVIHARDLKNVRRIAGFTQPLLLLAESGQAVAELIKRAGNMSILGVAFDVETLCALPLKQRELDVVREEKELICARHGWRERMDWIGLGWVPLLLQPARCGLCLV